MSQFSNVLLWILSSMTGQRTYNLGYEGMELVMIDPAFAENVTLKVTRVNDSHNVINGEVSLHQRIDYDIKVDIFAYEERGSEYRRSTAVQIRNQTLCKFLESEEPGKSQFRNATNLPVECPITPGNYYIRDFLLDPSGFPPHIPGQRWRGDVMVFRNDVTLAHLQVYLLVEPQNFRKMRG